MRTQKTTTTVVVAVRSIVRTDGPTDATNTDVVFRIFDKTKNTLSFVPSLSLSFKALRIRTYTKMLAMKVEHLVLCTTKIDNL